MQWRSRGISRGSSRAEWREKENIPFMSGILLGAGLMYYLDPDKGRRRRALVRDKVISFTSHFDDVAETTGRNIIDELQGLLSSAASMLSPNGVSDRVLFERVRSKMGRYVSHPSSIKVLADNGTITLRGPILEHEVKRLISSLYSVPGVKEIRNELDAHKAADNIPALQGGSGRVGDRPEILQANWSPAFRTLMGGMGLGALACARKRGKILGRGILMPLGILALVRAITNTELKRVIGTTSSRRAVDIHKTINIAQPLETVFDFWNNFENFPKFMPHLKEVKDLGNGRSKWVALGPGNTPFEWVSLITKVDPNSLIAWKSEEGASVPNAGLIRFSDNQQGGTQLDIKISYNPPLGAVGHMAASLFRSDLKTALDQGLLRLKSLLEEGKATSRDKEVTLEQVAEKGRIDLAHDQDHALR